ncbi:hypothetical protein B0H19DRAFT_1082065 [Mycena capillaripes]|nr:hypothetical protein B0H19DRAFT_1082065 [Mycena capillaripes]
MVFLASFAAAFAFCGLLAQQANAQAFPVPSLTPQQVTGAQIAMVQMAQTPENQDRLAADVAAAAAAAAGISNNFTLIGTQLQTIDNENLQPQKFFPTWQTFRDVSISRAFTAILSLTASSCRHTTNYFKTPRTLLAGSQATPTQSTTFQTSSSALAVKFNELSSNITEFTGNFANFAANRSASDNTQIDNLLEQIASLEKEINDIEISMIALGIGMGATLIGTAAGLVFFPEAAPFILARNSLIGAAIAEGILIGTEIVGGPLRTVFCTELTKRPRVWLQPTLNKLGGLQGQVQTLRTEISLINSTQAALNRTATQDVPALTSHLALFTGVWQDVASDCTKLIGWLNLGANNTDMPDVLAVFLNQSTTIYNTMSVALTQYATQVVVPSK